MSTVVIRRAQERSSRRKQPVGQEGSVKREWLRFVSCCGKRARDKKRCSLLIFVKREHTTRVIAVRLIVVERKREEREEEVVVEECGKKQKMQV